MATDPVGERLQASPAPGTPEYEALVERVATAAWSVMSDTYDDATITDGKGARPDPLHEAGRRCPAYVICAQCVAEAILTALRDEANRGD